MNKRATYDKFVKAGDRAKQELNILGDLLAGAVLDGMTERIEGMLNEISIYECAVEKLREFRDTAHDEIED